VIGRLDRLDRFHHRWRREQFPGPCNVGPAFGAGEQAIVADAVKTLRQDVQQKAPNELVRSQGHDPVALGTVAAIVLLAEGHATLIERTQPPVRDRHPVGVTRQIGEHRRRPGEWCFGIDMPRFLADGR
jgi:hypothetical protein